MYITRSTQPEKARLGAVGEYMVVSMLMQHGWDAFNANCTIKNYKSIDIVCLNSEIKETPDYPWKPVSALIQVKTSVQKNIPTGFTIEDSLKRGLLEERVMGPYVFVYVDMIKNGSLSTLFFHVACLLSYFILHMFGTSMIGIEIKKYLKKVQLE